MKLKIKSEQELLKVCEKLEPMLQHASVVLLNGDMGAGKTTFVKKYCEYKGIEEPSSSPTFGIVNEYHAEGGDIYHFDLYRIKEEEELYDIGLEEYLDSGNICFIEWPEIASNFIYKPYILLNLLVQSDFREVELKLIN